MSFILDKAVTKEEMFLLKKEINKRIFDSIKSSIGLGFNIVRGDKFEEALAKPFDSEDTITFNIYVPVTGEEIENILKDIRKERSNVLHTEK